MTLGLSVALWLLFNSDAQKAVVYGAFWGLVGAAVAARLWSRDPNCLDPARQWHSLALVLAVVLGSAVLGLFVDAPHGLTWDGLVALARGPADSAFHLFALFVGATSLPIAIALSVRAKVVHLLATRAGIPFDQFVTVILNSRANHSDRRLPSELRSELILIPMFIAIVPGVWMARHLRKGNADAATAVAYWWVPLMLALLVWLHWKRQAHLAITLPGIVILLALVYIATSPAI